jgi:long-chain acyl-CoA synthetase
MTKLRDRPGDRSPLEMFDQTVSELADRPLLHSFKTPIGAREVADLVDGLASGMQSHGVRHGDRVGLYLQNDPQYVIALLAAWRLGAVAVPCNPMLRHRELAHHLQDAGVSALVVLDDLYEIADRAREEAVGIGLVIVTGRDDLQGLPSSSERAAPPVGTCDLLTLSRDHARTPYERVNPEPNDVAVLTYTSGTTGPAKGAMNTHGNIAYASRCYRDWLGVQSGDTILGIAPLYHVTGLTGHIGLALASGASLILAHRFDPAIVAELLQHHRATVTIAAITAFMALANDERARAYDYSSIRRAYSGGAPVPPAVVTDLHERLGLTIRPVYGLTETTGPTHFAPPDADPPVHSGTGALSVGLLAPGTQARIAGEHGETLPAGELGEVLVRGPQIVPGYWQRPEETAAAIPDGELHTGDVGVIDSEGWLYLVDRRKDMIIASGFKVWPREVEDVLYEHEAVREAAVVGVPDEYRGETVWAYVSLKPGLGIDPAELVAHCRERLAAYKYPRIVHILDELPKTPSGKILRRELRERQAAR